MGFEQSTQGTYGKVPCGGGGRGGALATTVMK